LVEHSYLQHDLQHGNAPTVRIRNIGEEKDSSEMAEEAIRYFMLGYGFSIPPRCILRFKNSSSITSNDRTFSIEIDALEALEKAFVDLFAIRIEELIKRKPHLVKEEDEEEEDEEYVIYYK
jgi:hypothetical protein